jgi:endo-1,4-beta-mannosidase
METLVDQSYTRLRGFNYQPSYAATGLRIWSEFDAQQVRVEIGRGKRCFPGMNAVRLWLSHDAYVHDAAQFCRNFEAALAILAEHQVRAVACLFNNWHSIPDFGGIAAEQVGYWHSPDRPVDHYLRYLDDVVGAHAADPRVVMWDLCNEPFNSGREDVFVPWLRDLTAHCKGLGARAPLTIGVPPVLSALELVEPLCDVLSPHLYNVTYERARFEAMLDQTVAFANKAGKPMIAGETGWGHLDGAIRLRTLLVELECLDRRGIGFLVHMLHHSLVADGHRAEYGPVSHVGFMGCIEADGSLRAGYDAINSFFQTRS